MSGDSRSPRVGCGAAILRDSKLLLVKRKRPPETNHLGLPGGKVDWLEPVAAAIAREIAEELGLAIRPQRLHRYAWLKGALPCAASPACAQRWRVHTCA
jgi:ADP-ribose pyrophosphatase YjhB (NUDIX family)